MSKGHLQVFLCLGLLYLVFGCVRSIYPESLILVLVVVTLKKLDIIDILIAQSYSVLSIDLAMLDFIV